MLGIIKKLTKKQKVIGVLVFGVLLLIGTVLIFVLNGDENEKKEEKFIPTPTPTITESPVPSPTEVQEPTVAPTTLPTQAPSPVPNQNVNVLNCTDCKLASVDKTHQLPSTYIPSVVPTGLSGGGYLTLDAKTALSQMFSDAQSQGINMTIVSSYRSFVEQKSTFEYWVQREINNGYSRVEAERRANEYSARQGHSEHQLGTTVDLKCTTCGSFDNSQGNMAVYEYIEKNAHKYGFVVSYPEGKQNLTGYVYEAWHIRYIGEDLAEEFYNLNYLSSSNSHYLAKFLRDKGY